MKKLFGIFYKSWFLQLHYLPLAIIVTLVFKLISYMFSITFQWYVYLVAFLISFVSISLTDQVIHAIGSLFGMKD